MHRTLSRRRPKMKIEKTLISLTQYMEKQEIPYVIVGGFAAAA